MKKPLWLIRLSKFEYWPWYIFYMPLVPYLFYLCIRAKSVTHFTACNPCMPHSGIKGESKYDILKRIPSRFVPDTFFIETKASVKEVLEKTALSKITYPFIAKPDVGERGKDVSLIRDVSSLKKYFAQPRAATIIQAYVDLPLELGIMYYRLPGAQKGKVTSVVQKAFLAVRGDGRARLHELIAQNERARFQYERLQNLFSQVWHKVLPDGETLVLENIGNHSRGTGFVNANHMITDLVNEVMDEIAKPIEGFYYGRFDLRCSSWPDLLARKNIYVLELNGLTSEPGHVYDPNYKLADAYRDILNHWKIASRISLENMRRGIKPSSLKAFLSVCVT